MNKKEKELQEILDNAMCLLMNHDPHKDKQ